MPETEEEKKAKEAAEAAAKAAAEATAKQPFATFPDPESFNKRVEREARAMLKAAGITETDPVKLKAIIDNAAKMAADQTAAEEAKKSEIQKAAEASAAAKAAAEAAMSAKEEAEMKAHLYKVCAEQGVKNIDYAVFKIQSKLATIGDNEELDEVKYLEELKANAAEAAALGIVAVTAPKTEGANTTNQGAQPDPKPGEPGGGAPQPKSVMDMSKEEFGKVTHTKYGFTPF